MADAKALYSASEEDLDTVICFLVLQEMRELPKKKHWPEIDLLVSRQPAQSASEKPCKVMEELLGKNKPLPGQTLRYLRSLRDAL